MWLPLALLVCLSLQQEEELRFDVPILGVVEPGDPDRSAPELEDFDFPPAIMRGDVYRLHLEEPAALTIELRSDYFDPLLVLRHPGGEPIGLDDNSGAWLHGLLTGELPAGDYLVEALAKRGHLGEYRLELRRGLTQPADVPPGLDEALQRLERVEERHGAEHPAAVLARWELGEFYLLVGQYAEAIEPLRRAREALLASSEAAPQDLARCTNGLARALERTGQYDEARATFEASIAAFDAAGLLETKDGSDPSYNLGLLELNLGNYAESRVAFTQNLELTRTLFGEDHGYTWEVFNAIAFVHYYEGDLNRCVELLEQSHAAMVEGEYSPRRLGLAKDLLSTMLSKQGHHERAREMSEESVSLLELAGGPTHPETLIALNNLAIVLSQLSDSAAAVPVLQRLVDHYEDAGIPWSRETLGIFYNLGVNQKELGERELARVNLERCLELSLEVLGADHLDVAETQLALAHIELQLGDAEGALRRARAAEQVMMGESPLLGIPAQNALMYIHADLGNYDLALECIERSIEGLETYLGAHGLRGAYAIRDRGQLHWLMGQPEAAFDDLAAAHARCKQHLELYLGKLSESERIALLARLRVALDGMISVLSDLTGASGGEAALATYDQILAWKGRATALLGAPAGTDERVPEELLGRLRASQSTLSRLAFGGRGLPAAERAAEIAQERERRKALELEVQGLLRDSGGLDELVGSADELLATLPDGLAVVDYFVHVVYVAEDGFAGRSEWQRNLSAWVLRKDRGLSRFDLGPVDELAPLVQDYLGWLVGSDGRADSDSPDPDAGDPNRPNDPNQLVRARLWDPLAAELEGVGTLVVSPDGFLGTLPFEALRTREGRFLVEDRRFVYLESVAMLVDILGREPRAAGLSAGDTLLALGGVDFGATPAESGVGDERGPIDGAWAPLTRTLAEARLVARLHRDAGGGSQVLLSGSEATEARVKQSLSGRDVVHLATHGFFTRGPTLMESIESPPPTVRGGFDGWTELSSESERLVGDHPGLLSGLVFAGAGGETPSGGEDGYLTADELQWLDLSGARLMVLSACETALGEARAGEGLNGLRRACHAAGADTVVSSLWRVGDNAASDVMESFYSNLWERNLAPLDALREAQLERIRLRQPPRDWAAFVLSGDWR